MAGTNIVNADRISKSWGTRTVLSEVSLGLSTGDVIGVVGTVAMLWVGGHLIVRGLDEVFGWHWPHEIIAKGQEAVGGGALGWMVETGISMIVGLIVGFIVLGVVQLVKKLR